MFKPTKYVKTATALKALQGSIKKWEKIVFKGGKDLAEENCSLCKKYQNKKVPCAGCPVNEKSKNSCRDTPYEQWFYHQLEHRDSNVKRVHDGCTKCEHIAKEELKFLKSLLPKEVKK